MGRVAIFPISHLVPGISSWGAISRFPFPTSHSSSCVEAHIQFPISHFPQPLHNPGIGGVGNERSKDKVKDQFPEGDNESGEFPISHCPISNGKLGMCITLKKGEILLSKYQISCGIRLSTLPGQLPLSTFT